MQCPYCGHSIEEDDLPWIHIDLVQWVIRINQRRVTDRPQTIKVFYILYGKRGQLVPYEEIFSKLWGGSPEGIPMGARDQINQAVATLRKIVPECRFYNVHSEGYVLEFSNIEV